ncbi:MAG: hypothetical protein ACK51P_20545, partial [Microcystis sp.]|uniref:hypothetical protein n=1 Tax=Microcystis sp. TaxID=1127 RepID=UPI00391F98F9
LTLPIPYGRHATIERRFSPTRFIRRHAAVVPALGLASAADKRYSLEVYVLLHYGRATSLCEPVRPD